MPAAEGGMSEPLPSVSESRLHSESDFPVEFVRQNLRRVFTLIYRIVGNVDEAQELTQETFIKVFQRKAGATDLRKAEAALPVVASDTAMQFLGHNRNTHLTESGRNDACLARDLQTSLDRLPAIERANLLLRDVEGVDAARIARYTRTSVGAVRMTIARARTKIRQYLQTGKQL
jgi:RNA polymerase sigma-70 factor, ECF subfamily